MHDRELYRQILGIQAPWRVSEVKVDLAGGGVTVHITHSGDGLARRAAVAPEVIGIDETSFQRRHEYVTVISEAGRVLHVADGRGREATDAWFAGQKRKMLANLNTVAMDMWPAYISSTLAHVPNAESKIAICQATPTFTH